VPDAVLLVDVESVAVVGVDVAADPVEDSVDDVSPDVELAELVEDSDDAPVVSAAATPWPVATAVTSHAATAIPPYPPSFAALWPALRDGALDEVGAKRGLTG
jgi:hypothetical protein